MFARVRPHLSFANAVAMLALFIALGAGAYAAGLKPNSVKSKHIKDNQVKSADVKNNGLTGQDVDESSLQLAVEDWQPLGLKTGDGGATCKWESSADPSASYFRDLSGVVHLRGWVAAIDGTATCGSGADDSKVNSGNLPPGYRPDGGATFRIWSLNGTALFLFVNPDGALVVNDANTAQNDGTGFSLDGISWGCGPAGSNGCP